MSEKRSYFSRALVILMAVMLIFTMMPSGMWGGVETAYAEEQPVSITFTYSSGNELVYGPVTLNVTAGLAYSYGIGNEATTSPTVLDAIVAAHVAKYGAETFKTGSTDSYITLGAYGPTKVFGNGNSSAGHIVNGHYSSALANQAVLKSGDTVDIFTYHSDWNDNYVAFYQNNGIAREVYVAQNEEVELTAKSFDTYSAWQGETWSACLGLPIGTTDAKGNFTTKNVSSDENGKVKVSFDTTGTYYLTSKGATGEVIPPWCKINVVETSKSATVAAVNAAVAPINASDIKAYKADNTTVSDVAADLQKVTSNLKLPECTADGVTFSWKSTNSAIAVNSLTGTVTRPTGSNATGQLIVTATKDGISASKAFDVTVLATGTAAVTVDAKIALEKITDRYATQTKEWWGNTTYSTGSWWQVAVMGAYNAQFGKDKLSSDQKQAIVDKAIATAATNAGKIGSYESGEATTINQLGSAVTLLSALGYDVENLTTVNGSTIKAGSSLNRLSLVGAEKTWYLTYAPYTLIALQQGSFGNQSIKDSLVDYLISKKISDGVWGWDGTNLDVDTTAMILHGLATQSSNEKAKAAIEKGIDTLATAFAAKDGYTFGNANTDAVVIIALAACGIDPNTDTRFVKEGKSIVDGMLTYLNTDMDAFTYTYNGVTSNNESATEQATLALIAAEAMCGSKSAVNILDFSSGTKVAATAKSTGSAVTPTEPTGDNITVRLSIKDDNGSYWVYNKSVTVKGTGATVYHAFVKACTDASITQIGAADGYVSSITKGTKTLAEFTNGSNSGWLYKVNGELPNVGLTECSIKNGDTILWYYTNDWTKDPDAGKWASSGTTTVQNVTTDTKTSTTTAPTYVKVTEQTGTDGSKEKVAEVTVSSANQKEILKQAKANKSKEIVLNASSSTAKDASKVNVNLDKSFVNSIVSNTDAKLTVKTPLGDKTYTQDELKALAAAATGSTVVLTIEKAAVDDTDANVEKAVSGAADTSSKDRSVKTSKGNVKITFKPGTKTQSYIDEMKELGYTVKYRFYRSTKKSSDYKAMLTKTTKTYLNTVGKSGTRYYYKTQIRVYDKDGKLIAKTALKDCKYATRIFG